MLKLYYFPFSNPSAKVKICLLEKGIEFTEQLVDLANKEHLSDWYAKINPDCAVPTLVHDDKIITESNVILEYIEDAFSGPKLMPLEPYLKAQVRLNFRYDESLLHDFFVLSFDWMIKTGRLNANDISLPKIQHPNSMKKGFYHDLGVNKGIPEEKFEMAKQNIFSSLKALNDRMDNVSSQYVVGDSFSLADIAWIAGMQRLELVGLPVWESDSSFFKLNAWWNLIKSRDSFQKVFA